MIRQVHRRAHKSNAGTTIVIDAAAAYFEGSKMGKSDERDSVPAILGASNLVPASFAPAFSAPGFSAPGFSARRRDRLGRRRNTSGPLGLGHGSRRGTPGPQRFRCVTRDGGRPGRRRGPDCGHPPGRGGAAARPHRHHPAGSMLGDRTRPRQAGACVLQDASCAQAGWLAVRTGTSL